MKACQTSLCQQDSELYNSLLRESIDRFLAQYRNGVTDFFDISSIFSRLLQNSLNPPIPFIWFYTALAFHTRKLAPHQHLSTRVLVVKELFQSLLSCSDSACSLKRISILAPVVYELFNLVVEHKILKIEVEDLLEGVVGYCCICCGKQACEDDDGVGSMESNFTDLIPVWMVDKFGAIDLLKGFFPVVTDQTREWVALGCGIRFLAGIVLCEVFLLRLFLKFEYGITKAEQRKHLHVMAVQMINGFQNLNFLEILFRMLLEPILPLTSLLSAENEVIVREVLLDVIMVMEYPLQNVKKLVSEPEKHLKDLALMWVFVADAAIKYVREKGDKEKTASYVNAFSRSCLTHILMNWAVDQTGVVGNIDELDVSSPSALIKWLLRVQAEEGLVFDGNMVKQHVRAVFCKTSAESVLPVMKDYHSKQYVVDSSTESREEAEIDGDTEMLDSVDKTISSNGSMYAIINCDTRKRKEFNDESKLQVKLVKYQIHESSIAKKLVESERHDAWISGSEEDNPISDHDVEVMEQ